MSIQQANKFRLSAIEKKPEKEKEINELYQLMKDEIEDGGSPSNEVELFINSVNELLNE